MGGFNVDGDGKRERRRENGDSQSCAYHRRSKSASDKNMDSSTNGASHSIPKNSNDSLELLSTMRSSGRQSCVHECPRSGSTDAVINHRASLEKDIEQLQLRLQQEKSMRMLLERAMGRASSTLSPGHRHFAAQTKELIAEIELLEEEVANREHYVLSLYRSIFENCVSQPSSERSSVVSSPARTKKETRKHPSIISSAFCSSKFPLRPFRAMGTVNDSGKKNLVLQSKTRHASMFSGKANIHLEKRCSDHSTVQTRLPTMNKTSVIRTLKDHIYQCPSKLSEEMVKCMAAVYCWLRSVNGEQNRSPMLSRSSTNVILPRRGHLEDKEWSCKSMVEISCLSTDKSNFSHAAYAMNNYRVLVEQLEKVNVREMEANAQTAFWINLYNSLVMHAYLAYGISHSSLRRLALFHKAAYKVDGHVVNANAIEQAIFCFRTPRNGRWLETLLSTAKRKRSGEENQEISSKFRLQNFQPLICFALCTGALSDPVLKVYTGSNIKEEIQEAKKEFLESNIVVEKSKKVFLPKLLERFSREASIASDDILNWVIENVDTKLRDLIQKCVECKSKKKMSQIIEWLAYSSRFRYVFSKELAEKPWWA